MQPSQDAPPGLSGQLPGQSLTCALRPEATIDTSGPNCPHIVAPLKATTGCDWYWTSTPFEGSTSSAWLVYFYYGAGYVDDLTYKYRVRCVR